MTDLEKIKKLREIDNFKPRPKTGHKRKTRCAGCGVSRPRSR